jgi:hypothetical protein
MPHHRLPDCRPPRRDDSITSASSHPELLIGEIVMRPRLPIALSTAERDMLWAWRKRVLAVCALLAAGVIGHSMLSPGNRTVAEGVSKDEQARTETCVQHTGALADAADRQMPGQVTQNTACAPAQDPGNRRGASTARPQTD